MLTIIVLPPCGNTAKHFTLNHPSENPCANRGANSTSNTLADASRSASTSEPASTCFAILQFDFMKNKKTEQKQIVLFGFTAYNNRALWNFVLFFRKSYLSKSVYGAPICK